MKKCLFEKIVSNNLEVIFQLPSLQLTSSSCLRTNYSFSKGAFLDTPIGSKTLGVESPNMGPSCQRNLLEQAPDYDSNKTGNDNNLKHIWSLRSVTATGEGRMYMGDSAPVFHLSEQQQYTGHGPGNFLVEPPSKPDIGPGSAHKTALGLKR